MAHRDKHSMQETLYDSHIAILVTIVIAIYIQFYCTNPKRRTCRVIYWNFNSQVDEQDEQISADFP